MAKKKTQNAAKNATEQTGPPVDEQTTEENEQGTPDEQSQPDVEQDLPGDGDAGQETVDEQTSPDPPSEPDQVMPPLGREKLPEEVQQKTTPEQRDTPNPDETHTRPAPVICERCKVEMKVSKTGRTTRFFKCPKCGCGAQRMKETVAQALKKQHEDRLQRAEVLKERAEQQGR